MNDRRYHPAFLALRGHLTPRQRAVVDAQLQAVERDVEAHDRIVGQAFSTGSAVGVVICVVFYLVGHFLWALAENVLP